MIEKRPLSSVVAVKLLGDAAGFSAVTVAPLIGLPASSLTDAADAAGLGGGARRASASDEQRGQHARRTDEDADACSKPPVKVQYILNSVKHPLAAAALLRPSIAASRPSRRANARARGRSSAGFAPIAPLVEARHRAARAAWRRRPGRPRRRDCLSQGVRPARGAAVAGSDDRRHDLRSRLADQSRGDDDERDEAGRGGRIRLERSGGAVHSRSSAATARAASPSAIC